MKAILTKREREMARKAAEKKIVAALKPLPQEKRIRVLKAVAILLDIPMPKGLLNA